MYKCKHFDIKELVSKAVYYKFGEFAWCFFDEDILKDLDIIRESWGSPLTINNWHSGGQYNESGLRSNVDSIVKNKIAPYLSGHVLAKAFDIKPQNKKSKEFHTFLWNFLKTGKLKAFKRLENGQLTPDWIHIDALRTQNGNPEIF